MTDCKRIQEMMVTEEPLGEEGAKHLQACSDCASFAATVQMTSAALTASRYVPSAGETQTVRTHVTGRLRPRPSAFRLAWAAMAVGVLVVVTILSVVPGSSRPGQTDDGLLALLDEVNDITSVANEEPIEDAGEDAVLMSDVLYKEDHAGDDFELALPGSYELLEEALDNSWL